MTALLAFPNRADEAALTGGLWSSALPRSNLQTRTIKEVARTSDATEASTQFLIDMGKARGVRVLALVDHNCTLDATYRVRGYTDGALTDLAYDSGVQPVFPDVYTESVMDWDDGTMWDLGPSTDYLNGLTATLIHILSERSVAQYWLVTLADAANDAGYLQFGRLFIGDGFSPAINMAYGASLQYESRDEIDETYSGAEYFRRRPSPRVARFELGGLTEDEAMSQAFDAQRILGTSGEVLFMYSTTDTTQLLRRSFLGRMRTLSATLTILIPPVIWH